MLPTNIIVTERQMFGATEEANVRCHHFMQPIVQLMLVTAVKYTLVAIIE
jgi:hypothetical protein